MNAVAESLSTGATPQRARTKPLLSLRAVGSLVDKPPRKVGELIESGEIAWAFALSLDQKPGRDRYIRALPAAVADYLKGRACELQWKDVIGLMLPDAPTILACEITRILNVSSDHTYHLIDGKQIIACPTTRRPGPGGSARVPRKSFIQFLQQRRCN
jgi:hypothetical protein